MLAAFSNYAQSYQAKFEYYSSSITFQITTKKPDPVVLCCVVGTFSPKFGVFSQLVGSKNNHFFPRMALKLDTQRKDILVELINLEITLALV